MPSRLLQIPIRAHLRPSSSLCSSVSRPLSSSAPLLQDSNDTTAAPPRSKQSEPRTHLAQRTLGNWAAAARGGGGGAGNRNPPLNFQGQRNTGPTLPAAQRSNDDLALNKRQTTRATGLERMQFRKWRAGDVYGPHDLGVAEAMKWQKPQRPRSDAFDVLGIDPLDEYKNFAMMAEFVTHTGRIRHGAETGLRAKNQRRLAKAVRRAVGLGLIPSVHRHPEMLMLDREKRERRRSP
ncbi:MAG: hypothetical protein M1825_000610 [Sarcosagium campestre]|nr:MAG: hypothetical protein M1825_000610 [Sarcosagium campestre]